MSSCLIVIVIVIVKTSLGCRHNDVTLIDVELHSKGSTDCENSDSTPHSIISRSSLEIFVYINHWLSYATKS